jgi:hypothetical protein
VNTKESSHRGGYSPGNILLTGKGKYIILPGIISSEKIEWWPNCVPNLPRCISNPLLFYFPLHYSRKATRQPPLSITSKFSITGITLSASSLRSMTGYRIILTNLMICTLQSVLDRHHSRLHFYCCYTHSNIHA